MDKEIDLRAERQIEQCHLLSCRIEHKGYTVKAREYFWPTVKELKEGGDEQQGREEEEPSRRDENTYTNPVMTASFRGRPLQGRKLDVPEGYKGVVVNKDPRSPDKSNGQFKHFTYWNWDEIPSKNDIVVKSLQLINVSQAIHGKPKIGQD